MKVIVAVLVFCFMTATTIIYITDTSIGASDPPEEVCNDLVSIVNLLNEFKQ